MSPADSCDFPHAFTFTDPRGGKTWEVQVGARTFEMEFTIQRHLEERALKVVQRHRETLPAAEYALAFDGWRRDCATGVYEFGGEHCWRFLTSRTGWVYNAWLQTKDGTPGLTRDVLERVYADPEAMKELDAKMAMMNSPFPTRKTEGPPGTPPAGSPSPTSSPASPESPSVTAAAAS